MSPGLRCSISAEELIGVLGASGSTRIVTALVQVISHLVDRRWDPWHRVGAPPHQCALAGSLQCEGRSTRPRRARRRRIGPSRAPASAQLRPVFRQGHVLGATMRVITGTGAADPRGEGEQRSGHG